MTATALIAELQQRGVQLARCGDRLHVEAKAGTVSAELRDRLIANKPELLETLDELDGVRAHLLVLAADDRAAAALVRQLTADHLAACRGLPDDTLRGYVRTLNRDARMDAGEVPRTYTAVTVCDGCGPVWVYSGTPARVLACPWCFRRKAGKQIPRPDQPMEDSQT